MATCAITPGIWFRHVCAGSELRCSTSEAQCPKSTPTFRITRVNSRWEGVGRIRLAAKKNEDYLLDATVFNDFEDDDDESGSDVDVALESMQDWKKSKPPGFGLDKDYDLSLEAKLLDEIERDKKAQAAAKNQRKGGVKPGKDAKKTVVEPPPPGFVVRLSNVPKKKNVDRDLRPALQGVQGLLHIRPIVSGTEKTREPTCTGLAFLTFSTEKDADRFISVFSGQLFKFGKVEKKLSLERCRNCDNQDTLPAAGGGPRLKVRERGLLEDSEYLRGLQTKGKSAENLDLTESAESIVFDDDASDTELQTLEEDIWNSLEDEDDDLVDAELEDEDNERPTIAAEEEDDYSEIATDQVALTSDNQHDSPRVMAPKRRGVDHPRKTHEEQVHLHEGETENSLLPAPQVLGCEQRPITASLLAMEQDGEEEESDQEDSDDEELGEMDIELETWGTEDAEDSTFEAAKLISREVILSSQQKLGETSSRPVDERDRKIQELERMVLSLQSELKAKTIPKHNPVKKLTEEEARQATEARIEALEKRVFWKIKNAMNSKEKSTSTEKQSKKVAERAPKPSPNLKMGKLGSSMRLKKKDRITFSGVLEKYSRQEVAQ